MGSMYFRKTQQTIIIPTADIVQQFLNDNRITFTNKRDIDELMFQIVNTLVNPNSENSASLESFPDLSRLWSTNVANDENVEKVIITESTKLQILIKQRLVDYGVYEGDDFSYFFLQFVGYDLILSYLPH